MLSDDGHAVRQWCGCRQSGFLMVKAWQLLCACVAILVATTAVAAPTVRIAPSTTNVEPTVEFTLQVYVDVDTISNFRVLIEFDPVVLELVEAIEGALYAESGMQTWFQVEEEATGVWEVFDVIFPAMSFVVGPGELFCVRFRALGQGSSAIHFQDATLMDVMREPLLPLIVEDGVVSVGDVTGVGDGSTPQAWDLGRPYPNPTRGSTHIALVRPTTTSRPPDAHVYDAHGRLVALLRDETGGADPILTWDGRDSRGARVVPGVYFVRLQSSWPAPGRRVIIVR